MKKNDVYEGYGKDKKLLIIVHKDLVKNFKIIPTPKKTLNTRIKKYRKYFLHYYAWRLRFNSFIGTRYLKKRKFKSYLIPDDKLLRDISKTISELRYEFINFKDFRAVIIFRLFIFYYAELYKVKKNLRLVKFDVTDLTGPKMDIIILIRLISENILNIPNKKNSSYWEHYLIKDHLSNEQPKIWKNSYEKDLKKHINKKSKNSVKIASESFFKLCYVKSLEKIMNLFDNKLQNNINEPNWGFEYTE